MSVFRTTFRHHVWRRILLGLTALLALGVGTMIAPSPASASATGCTFFGTGLHGAVRNGQFCAGVNGSGTYIETVHANFGMTIPGMDQVCNPSIKLDVFDRWDHWVTSRQGPQKSGCAWGSYNFPSNIEVYWDFPEADGGKVYVTLQASGSPVATVAFGIYS